MLGAQRAGANASPAPVLSPVGSLPVAVRASRALGEGGKEGEPGSHAPSGRQAPHPHPRRRLRPRRPCSKAAAGKMNLYESFAQATQLGDLHTCLMMDMKACQEDDVRLLCHLTPSIYTEVSAAPHPSAPGPGGHFLPFRPS